MGCGCFSGSLTLPDPPRPSLTLTLLLLLSLCPLEHDNSISMFSVCHACLEVGKEKQMRVY